MPQITLASFSSDITPPLGHPLCGGLVCPARSIDKGLSARGIVLLGIDEPVVLCALDWCAVRNDAHAIWRYHLADAAGTHPEKVAVQCVHQHNAPMADLVADRLVSQVAGTPAIIDGSYFRGAVEQTARQLRSSLDHAQRVTHYGMGQAAVARVGSNRRILDAEGKIECMRYSTARGPAARMAPLGTIDPCLKTLSFWNGSEPLAALHYYATHPMSCYGDGRVTSDFIGLARDEWQRRNPGVFQVYFTGCAGDIAAGKFNDGRPECQRKLAAQVLGGMKDAWAVTRRVPIERCACRTLPLKLPTRTEHASSGGNCIEEFGKSVQEMRERINAAFRLSWLAREDVELNLVCLDLGEAVVVHLPGEPFVFYQLEAQKFCPDLFVCVAAYGDGGPGYIPTDQAFTEGGYEPTVAMSGPGVERVLLDSIARLLGRRQAP